jgi:hypothetical protein
MAGIEKFPNWEEIAQLIRFSNYFILNKTSVRGGAISIVPSSFQAALKHKMQAKFILKIQALDKLA